MILTLLLNSKTSLQVTGHLSVPTAGEQTLETKGFFMSHTTIPLLQNVFPLSPQHLTEQMAVMAMTPLAG